MWNEAFRIIGDKSGRDLPGNYRSQSAEDYTANSDSECGKSNKGPDQAANRDHSHPREDARTYANYAASHARPAVSRVAEP